MTYTYLEKRQWFVVLYSALQSKSPGCVCGGGGGTRLSLKLSSKQDLGHGGGGGAEHTWLTTTATYHRILAQHNMTAAAIVCKYIAYIYITL